MKLTKQNKGVDMFCGASILKPQLLRCADTTVNQFVTCWTEHPKHMPLIILHHTEGSIPTIGWLVCDFQNPSFIAILRFTGAGQVRILTRKSGKQSICAMTCIPTLIVGLHGFWINLVKPFHFQKICLVRALRRAVFPVRAGLFCAIKLCFTYPAHDRNSQVITGDGVPALTACCRTTSVRTILLRSVLRLKVFFTIRALFHSVIIPQNRSTSNDKDNSY